MNHTADHRDDWREFAAEALQGQTCEEPGCEARATVLHVAHLDEGPPAEHPRAWWKALCTSDAKARRRYESDISTLFAMLTNDEMQMIADTLDLLLNRPGRPLNIGNFVWGVVKRELHKQDFESARDAKSYDSQ